MPGVFCMIEARLQQIAWIARIALALVFIWHGLVPKILWLSPDELAMIQAHDFPLPAHWVARLAGVGEILLGLLLMSSRWRWPVWLAAGLLFVLLLDVALFSPHLLLQAFNPVSTNLAALALCVVIHLAERPLQACS